MSRTTKRERSIASRTERRKNEKVLIATAFATACFASVANAADVAAGRAKAVQCQARHDMDSVAKLPEAPNRAGQNEDYLVKALNDFKSGARKNEMMSTVAKPLSEHLLTECEQVRTDAFT